MLEDFEIEDKLHSLSTDDLIEILAINELDGNVLLASNFDDFYETVRVISSAA